MIVGNKPSSYGVTLDENFRKKEVEFRQCSHCQTSWEYKPGSGHKVGMCYYCLGLLCTDCLIIRNTRAEPQCLPYYDTALSGNKKYVLEGNIFVRK